jgi:quercetin dioxygenase-like cupin family protein
MSLLTQSGHRANEQANLRATSPFAISLTCSNVWEVRMVPQGYVLGPRQGEHLVLRGGDMFIKVDPIGGSHRLAMGTQQILIGAGIPIHRHFEMDEAFCVMEGSGLFILDDVHHRIEKGASIFIPKNTWHGFENADSELVLLWMVAPPGLECLFREIATPAPIRRTKEQLNEIARKYGTEFR